jgi:hypothetical protein
VPVSIAMDEPREQTFMAVHLGMIKALDGAFARG